MKHLQLILQSVAACSVLSILAIIILTSGLSSCASDPTERRQQISQTANLALAVAEFTGRISPKQAGAARKAGVLLLDASEGKQPTLVQISNTAVDAALEWGRSPRSRQTSSMPPARCLWKCRRGQGLSSCRSKGLPSRWPDSDLESLSLRLS